MCFQSVYFILTYELAKKDLIFRTREHIIYLLFWVSFLSFFFTSQHCSCPVHTHTHTHTHYDNGRDTHTLGKERIYDRRERGYSVTASSTWPNSRSVTNVRTHSVRIYADALIPPPELYIHREQIVAVWVASRRVVFAASN